MRRWKQRVISLLLVVSMVFGLTQGNVLQVEAAAENLDQADGIIWLAKNEDGSSVSEEFESMVTGFKLDDMVRDALGIEDTSTKVYFDSVNIGNAMELLANMSKVESMIEDMKTAITNKELMTFNIGSKDGTGKTIAFRSIEGITFSAGDEFKIYINHAGAPESADTLKAMIQNALENTDVTVSHNGAITSKLYDASNKAGFKATSFAIEGGVSYNSLYKKWPSVTVSSDPVRKAGEVTVTIYAEEYEQNPVDKFKATETIEVYMCDQRIGVNAVAMKSDGTYVQDKEILSLTKEYSAAEPPSTGISSEHYRFVQWVSGAESGYPDYDYTAIMKAKIDNNGNGIHDDLEELAKYSVTYYVDDNEFHEETVEEGAMPIGPGPDKKPEKEGFKFMGWETDAGVIWPSKVTGNTQYHAQWEELDEENPQEFTVTATLVVDGTQGATQELSYDVVNAEENIYNIIVPEWDEIPMDGYECSGWYYYDSSESDEAVKVDFDKNEDWDATGRESLELYCEFVRLVEIFDPETGEIVLGKKDDDNDYNDYKLVISSEEVITLSNCLSAPSDEALEKYVPEYDENVTIFEGWHPIGENEYELAPKFKDIKNKVSVTGLPVINEENARTETEDGVIYNQDGYTTKIIIDGVGYTRTEDWSFSINPDTEITITPFADENGENIACYIDEVKAVKNGVRYPITTVIYGDKNDDDSKNDYNATLKNVYSDISGKARGIENSLSDVTLEIKFKEHRFKARDAATVEAGQDSYSEETIYKEALINTSPVYKDENVKIWYQALEDEYEVSLLKIFELLEADGRGFLKTEIEKLLDQSDDEGENKVDLEKYQVERSRTSEPALIELAEGTSKAEKTPQEAADEYLTQKYNEFNTKLQDKEFNTVEQIEEFFGNVIGGLDDAVYKNAHRKFGYIPPTEVGLEKYETVKIEYASDKIGDSLETQVKLADNRTETTMEVKANKITCSYNDDIKEAILANVDCSVDTELCVTYDGNTDTVRDFSNVGVDTYQVKVAYNGDAEHKPVLSYAFTLEVTPIETTVSVEQLITMEGHTYNKDVSATVNNDAPIVQIIAGVDVDELAFGVNTEGSIEKWGLEFNDKEILVDTWVALPESYIDLLSTLDLGNLKSTTDGDESDGESTSTGTIEPGKAYNKAELEEKLAEITEENVQLPQLQEILASIPSVISSRLGIDELNYELAVRFVPLGDNEHPIEGGFYVNYAATLSSFDNKVDGIEFDKNHTADSAYGFIVISPMVPIPNHDGVQLYDGADASSAQNVFVYEYDKDDAVPHALKAAKDGKEIPNADVKYYGFTTHADLTRTTPSKPGVYLAGYNYTEAVEGSEEVRCLGSDAAIIVIKPEEANLTITGDQVTYDGEKHFAEIAVTDKDGTDITDIADITVISGTVILKDDTTANVTANDFVGAVNVDFPNWLDEKWDAFWEDTGYNNADKIKPSDFIYFLKESKKAAEKAADKALEEFETLAMTDAVSDVLDKINGKQGTVDVSSENLVAKAKRVREELNSAVVYYDKLIKQLEPLENLDDNAWITFSDQEELNYSEKGYYLYLGVITDPDLTVDAGKGLVIIHTDKDYLMHETHVPYDGEPHTIFIEDETNRSDVKMMVKGNEISFFLDNDLFDGINDVLKALPHTDLKLNEGSDVVVSTVYENAEGKAQAVYDKLFELIVDKAADKLEEKFGTGTTVLDQEVEKARIKLDELTDRLSEKLQAVDRLEENTHITLYNMSYAEDLEGMPVNAGSYQFYGYSYDVAAERGTLVIEPIRIFIEDKDAFKYYGKVDPDLTADVTYCSIKGNDKEGIDENYPVELPSGVEASDIFTYTVTREAGEAVGKYDITVNKELLDTTGNYVWEERGEDLDDFEIRAVGEFGKAVEITLSLKGEVYIEFYPDLSSFDSDVLREGKGGLAIWTGGGKPALSSLVMPYADNCYTSKTMYWSTADENNQRWAFTTMGIPAKKYGDVLYMRPFIELEDGTYITGSLYSYSPEQFCKKKLVEGDKELKILCASILEYGAAAQEYFDYKNKDDKVYGEDLVNHDEYGKIDYSKYFAEPEKELAYSEELLDELVALPSDHVREYEEGSIRLPLDGDHVEATLTLDGAVVIEIVNYNLPDSIGEIDRALLQVWSEKDLLATRDFTYDSDSCTLKMEMSYGKLVGKEGYVASMKNTDSKYVGIPAKECGDTVYFMTYFVAKDGTVYRSGMRKYSPDQYIKSKVEGPNPSNNEEIKELCRRLAVYSEKARIKFGYKLGNSEQN